MLLNGRTDLACEAHQLWIQNEKKGVELSGVKVRDENIDGVSICSVEILDEKGKQALGKDIGKYYTMSLYKHFERGSQFFPEAAAVLSGLIRRCMPERDCSRFLIAALGNPDITPDALGPLAAANIIVTRHLKQASSADFSAFNETSLCRTGVLGTTGIESAMQIKMLCDKLKPDCVIAIDALAGADISRVCSSIQVSSTGIAPGSGVGNNRDSLCENSLGVPVIAVGMPTVIDAALLSGEDDFASMFVCPRDIDSAVRSAGRLIGYAVNLALHNGMSIADVDMLVG